jgi:hypothetical protein
MANMTPGGGGGGIARYGHKVINNWRTYINMSQVGGYHMARNRSPVLIYAE